MLLSNLGLIASLVSLGAACDVYSSCKCHDANTKQQRDDITKNACQRGSDWHWFGKADGNAAQYQEGSNHQCRAINGGKINNCGWQTLCQIFDKNTYQVCWDKDNGENFLNID